MASVSMASVFAISDIKGLTAASKCAPMTATATELAMKAVACAIHCGWAHLAMSACVLQFEAFHAAVVVFVGMELVSASRCMVEKIVLSACVQTIATIMAFVSMEDANASLVGEVSNVLIENARECVLEEESATTEHAHASLDLSVMIVRNPVAHKIAAAMEHVSSLMDNASVTLASKEMIVRSSHVLETMVVVTGKENV